MPLVYSPFLNLTSLYTVNHIISSHFPDCLMYGTPRPAQLPQNSTEHARQVPLRLRNQVPAFFPLPIPLRLKKTFPPLMYPVQIYNIVLLNTHRPEPNFLAPK